MKKYGLLYLFVLIKLLIFITFDSPKKIINTKKQNKILIKANAHNSLKESNCVVAR